MGGYEITKKTNLALFKRPAIFDGHILTPSLTPARPAHKFPQPQLTAPFIQVHTLWPAEKMKFLLTPVKMQATSENDLQPWYDGEHRDISN